VHKTAVLDAAFSPFLNNLLATGDEGGLVKCTIIPEDSVGIEKVVDSNSTLTGHTKKVALFRFNPTVNNLLASTSFDNSLKVWNIEEGKELTHYEFPELPQSAEWNEAGSLLITASKDKLVRLFDPRAPNAAAKGTAPEGGKANRALFFDSVNLIGCVGFGKTNARTICVYDAKKLAEPIAVHDIDTSGSVLIPHFDNDTGVLFLVGKGDSSIKYFEIVAEEPYVHFLSDFRESESIKGGCFLPKTACDTKSCEIGVCYRVMKDWISPVSFQVPRKSDLFQSDIFPDTYAGVPSMSPEEWISGANKPAIKRSMKPGTSAATGNVKSEFKGAAGSAAPASAAASGGSSFSQLDAANARIRELEAELARMKSK